MTHSPETSDINLAPVSGLPVMKILYQFHLVPDSGID